LASIKKLKNGTFQATISCGKNAEGKQIRKYITKDTQKECKSAAREFETEFEEGLIVNYQNKKFALWIDEWLELNKSRLKPSTYVSYKIYAGHFKTFFNNLKVSQITEIHIKRYINERLKINSACTVKKHLFVLSRMLQDILKNKNPCRDVQHPKKIKYSPHIITGDEFEKIKECVKGTDMEPIVLMSAWCGMRRGEICALKWDDIDWNNNTLRVDETVCVTESGYKLGTPKSQNGMRTVIAPKQLMALLEAIKKKDGLRREKVFTKSPGAVTSSFHWIAYERIGLPIRFHDLRHYHANWLRKNGVPDIYAAERLGHDVQTLKNIYQHIDSGERFNIEKAMIKLIETPGF
jgi:integrase